MSTRTPWTKAETALLRQHYPTLPGPKLAAMLGRPLRTVYHKAWSLGLRKTTETISVMARQAMQEPTHAGRQTQFKPGMTPWNKGTHFTAGGRSAETRFKRGEKRGAAQHNYVPIGSLRISKGGYLERKVNDTHPTPARRWIAVHRLVWEAANGPIPTGCIVTFKPGQKTAIEADITADRLECITKAQNLQRNSPRSKHPELAKLVQLKGAITRQVNRINREHNERQGSPT